jgi:hypothetical protein
LGRQTGLRAEGEISDIRGMSQAVLVTEDLIGRQSPKAQAIIRLLLARIAEQDRRIAALEAEVASRQKTPRNSSLPPGAEHPHAKPPRETKKGCRKRRGGQPGHPKHERALLPTEQCQAVVPRKPATCRRCGEALGGSDPEPLRHQVWDSTSSPGRSAPPRQRRPSGLLAGRPPPA